MPTERARRASGRGLVLLPAAALVVHQLRYWLTYGPSASNELADQGHAYLGSLVPWLVLLTVGGAALFIARIVRVRRGGVDAVPARSLAVLWLGASAGLLVVYALQEALEELFATGHPLGLAGIFGHGGWWSIPAATAVGLVLALLSRAGATLVRALARRAPRPRVRTVSAQRPAAAQLVRRRPLAAAAAGRAPPRLLLAC